MARDHLLAIDQGTTSTRAVVYDRRLRPVGQGQAEVPPTYPQSGWVEHDPAALVGSVGPLVAQALAEAGIGADRIAAVGLTNQRETTVVWDRADRPGDRPGPGLAGPPDRRRSASGTATAAPGSPSGPGLVLDPYFSATKIAWLLDHVPDARRRAEAGELAAGTVDSLLIWHLTGGRRHVTDATNASRTLLMDLRTLAWADDLCDFFDVPAGNYCPKSSRVRASSAGPRASTTCPTACRSRGWRATSRRRSSARGACSRARPSVPTAPGPSCWPTPATSVVPSTRGLVTTLAATLGDGPPQYALEGSVFVAGAAVQWFRDGLKAVGAAPEIDRLCLDADPDSGVLFVPALTGLGAPHWEPEARGTIFGLTRATTRRRPRPRHARRGRLPGRRPDRRDERRPRRPPRRPPRRRRHGPLRPVPPVPGRPARPPPAAEPAGRVDRPGSPPCSPAWASASGPTPRPPPTCSSRAARPSPPMRRRLAVRQASALATCGRIRASTLPGHQAMTADRPEEPGSDRGSWRRRLLTMEPGH